MLTAIRTYQEGGKIKGEEASVSKEVHLRHARQH